MSDLLCIAISITSVLDVFSVHDILNILQRKHSSAASSILSVSLFTVQNSHPYKRTDQTCFEGINFGVDGNVSVCKYGFHFPESFPSHNNSLLYFSVTLCIL